MKLITVKVQSIRLLLISLVLFITFIFFIDVLSISSYGDVKVVDNTSRINFIRSLGVIPDENLVEEKDIFIPENFTDVWNRYNEIQHLAGYDLLLYAGKNVKLYKYKISDFNDNTNVYINLIVLDGRVIGGDISSSELNGFMLPLKELKN